MSDIAELLEKAKDAFYAWEDKCATEWGSGLSDEHRIIWCEGYVQAKLEEKQDDNPYIFNPEDASDAYREPTDYTKFLKKEEKTL